MSEPKITFFDIPSLCKPQAWSPNTWKARLVLNYKQIPYKTVWVAYPDIEDTLKKIGGKPTDIKPNTKDGSNEPLYTLPAILDESTDTPVVITESLAIMEYLDAKYPDRPVLPKRGRALEHAFARFFGNIPGEPIPRLMTRPTMEIHDARSKLYVEQTRWDWYNIKCSEISPEGPVRDGHWNELEKGLDKLAEVLDKNGPDAEWVAGHSEPTRADFTMVAWLLWIKIVSPDEWEKKVKPLNGGRWDKLLKKTEAWQTVE
ncbi:hypothetical protein BU17DRAFT_67714 [Hysterangium stoloniferum]|nr:hypothetical protein BU17DRAFT_67714 [Hysterangium stoloniferum]